MSILIYGGGAVGLGIASCILSQGVSVDILVRERNADALRTHGLRREGIFGEVHISPERFQCFTKLEEIKKPSSYEYIFICTKSFDSAEAARRLHEQSHLWNEKSRFVLFQNGWGNAEKFAVHFAKSQIFNARVITGFMLTDLHQVKVTVHADAIRIGSLFQADVDLLREVADWISLGGIPTELTDHIQKDLWAKMLYNCALNPLGALFQVHYGALAESEHTRWIMKDIVSEIFTVMNRAGYQTYWQDGDTYLGDFYSKILPPTYKHEASMLQDIRAKKRTEIEALNGAVVRLGEELGVDTRTNEQIVRMIRFIEERNTHQS